MLLARHRLARLFQLVANAPQLVTSRQTRLQLGELLGFVCADHRGEFGQLALFARSASRCTLLLFGEQREHTLDLERRQAELTKQRTVAVPDHHGPLRARRDYAGRAQERGQGAAARARWLARGER